MNEILFRLKYNSLLHWVINGKIISKIFRVKEKAYRDYQLKHSLQKYMPAFDVLSDVIKHLIYLLVVSFASFNANDFVIWFMFLMVGGFSTKILNMMPICKFFFSPLKYLLKISFTLN